MPPARSPPATSTSKLTIDCRVWGTRSPRCARTLGLFRDPSTQVAGANARNRGRAPRSVRCAGGDGQAGNDFRGDVSRAWRDRCRRPRPKMQPKPPRRWAANSTTLDPSTTSRWPRATTTTVETVAAAAEQLSRRSADIPGRSTVGYWRRSPSARFQRGRPHQRSMSRPWRPRRRIVRGRSLINQSPPTPFWRQRHVEAARAGQAARASPWWRSRSKNLASQTSLRRDIAAQIGSIQISRS